MGAGLDVWTDQKAVVMYKLISLHSSLKMFMCINVSMNNRNSKVILENRKLFPLFNTDSVQFSSATQPCPTPWTAARQASLSITNSRSLLRLMSVESVMPSNHFVLCHPLLSRLQSFSASGSSQMSQFLS